MTSDSSLPMPLRVLFVCASCWKASRVARRKDVRGDQAGRQVIGCLERLAFLLGGACGAMFLCVWSCCCWCWWRRESNWNEVLWELTGVLRHRRASDFSSQHQRTPHFHRHSRAADFIPRRERDKGGELRTCWCCCLLFAAACSAKRRRRWCWNRSRGLANTRLARRNPALRLCFVIALRVNRDFESNVEVISQWPQQRYSSSNSA